MRAEVNGCQRCTGFLEFCLHVIHEGLEVAFRVVAAADAGLVRHDDEQVTGFSVARRGLEHAGNPLKVFPTRAVGGIDVDDAVAIQKDRAA